MSVRCYGYHYKRSEGPEKDSGMFALLTAPVFVAWVADLLYTYIHTHTHTHTHAVTSNISVLDTDVIEDKMKVRWFFFRSYKLNRQRTLDCRQCFPCCCQPCCLPIVSTPQHAHTNTHIDTEHSMVKSLSEIRLTSSVYLTSFEEVRVQTHTHTHTHTHKTVPLITCVTRPLCHQKQGC